MSAKGTNVMSDTSFVTAMLKKKGRNTSTTAICRVERVRRSSAPPSHRKTPAFCSPRTTAIRQKSMASVSQSM